MSRRDESGLAGGGGAGGGSDAFMPAVSYREHQEALKKQLMPYVSPGSQKKAAIYLHFDDVHWHLYTLLQPAERARLWRMAVADTVNARDLGDLANLFEPAFPLDDEGLRLGKPSPGVPTALMLGAIRGVLMQYIEELNDQLVDPDWEEGTLSPGVKALLSERVTVGLGSAKQRLMQNPDDASMIHKGRSYGLVFQGKATWSWGSEKSPELVFHDLFSTHTRVQVDAGHPDALLWGGGYSEDPRQFVSQLMTLYAAGYDGQTSLHWNIAALKSSRYLFGNVFRQFAMRAWLMPTDKGMHLGCITYHDGSKEVKVDVVLKVGSFEAGQDSASHELTFTRHDTGVQRSWLIVDQTGPDEPNMLDHAVHEARWSQMRAFVGKPHVRWASNCQMGQNRSQFRLAAMRMLAHQAEDADQMKKLGDLSQPEAVQALVQLALAHIEVVTQSSGKQVAPHKQFVNVVDAFCDLHAQQLGEHQALIHLLAICTADMRAGQIGRFCAGIAMSTVEGKVVRRDSPFISSLKSAYQRLDFDDQSAFKSILPQLKQQILGSENKSAATYEQRFKRLTASSKRPPAATDTPAAGGGEAGGEAAASDQDRQEALKRTYLPRVKAHSKVEAGQMLTFDDVHWYLLDTLSTEELESLRRRACLEDSYATQVQIGAVLRLTEKDVDVSGMPFYNVEGMDREYFREKYGSVERMPSGNTLLDLVCLRDALGAFAEDLRRSFPSRGTLTSDLPATLVVKFNQHVHMGLGSASDRLGPLHSDDRTQHKGRSYGPVFEGSEIRCLPAGHEDYTVVKSFFSTLTRVQVMEHQPEALLWGRGYPLQRDQFLKQLITLYHAGVSGAQNVHLSFAGSEATPYLLSHAVTQFLGESEAARLTPDASFCSFSMQGTTVRVQAKLGGFEDGVARHELIFSPRGAGETVSWTVLEYLEDDAPRIRQAEEHRRRWELMRAHLDPKARWAVSCQAGENRSQAALIQGRMLLCESADRDNISTFVGGAAELHAKGLVDLALAHVQAIGESSGRGVLPSKQYVNLVDAYCHLHRAQLGDDAQVFHFLALCAADMQAAVTDDFYHLDAQYREKGPDGERTGVTYRELSLFVRSMVGEFEALTDWQQFRVTAALQPLMETYFGRDAGRMSICQRRCAIITDAGQRQEAYPYLGYQQWSDDRRPAPVASTPPFDESDLPAPVEPPPTGVVGAQPPALPPESPVAGVGPSAEPEAQAPRSQPVESDFAACVAAAQAQLHQLRDEESLKLMAAIQAWRGCVVDPSQGRLDQAGALRRLSQACASWMQAQPRGNTKAMKRAVAGMMVTGVALIAGGALVKLAQHYQWTNSFLQLPAGSWPQMLMFALAGLGVCVMGAGVMASQAHRLRQPQAQRCVRELRSSADAALCERTSQLS